MKPLALTYRREGETEDRFALTPPGHLLSFDNARTPVQVAIDGLVAVAIVSDEGEGAPEDVGVPSDAGRYGSVPSATRLLALIPLANEVQSDYIRGLAGRVPEDTVDGLIRTIQAGAFHGDPVVWITVGLQRAAVEHANLA